MGANDATVCMTRDARMLPGRDGKGMSSNVIATIPLRDDSVAAWFDDGTSKQFGADELGIADEAVLSTVRVRNDGSGIEWSGGSIDAEALLGIGMEVNYVEDEKRRLLKSLSSIRRQASFSQTRLGEAAGIRQSVISRIEGCEISPQINTLLKLLAPLGKTLAIVDLEDVE